MRQLITKSIVSNIRLILDSGNKDAIKTLFGYAEEFEEILKEEILIASPEVGAQLFKDALKAHPLMPPEL